MRNIYRGYPVKSLKKVCLVKSVKSNSHAFNRVITHLKASNHLLSHENVIEPTRRICKLHKPKQQLFTSSNSANRPTHGIHKLHKSPQSQYKQHTSSHCSPHTAGNVKPSTSCVAVNSALCTPPSSTIAETAGITTFGTTFGTTAHFL